MSERFLDKEWREFVNFIEERDELFKKDFPSDWEANLTSDYWKNWREKVFKCKEDIDFFRKKVLKLRSYILWVIRYYRGDRYDVNHIKKLVEIKEKKLENMSWEKVEKEGRFISPGFKELSAQEMLNDSWFNREIDNLFGLEIEKLPKEEKKSIEKDNDNHGSKDIKKLEEEGKNDHENWTHEQLISEINRLKTENEQLKNDQGLTSLERQKRLQQNRQRLEQIRDILSSKNIQQSTNNNSFTPLLISGVVLAAIGLVSLLVVKRTKKIKRQN